MLPGPARLVCGRMGAQLFWHLRTHHDVNQMGISTAPEPARRMRVNAARYALGARLGSMALGDGRRSATEKTFGVTPAPVIGAGQGGPPSSSPTVVPTVTNRIPALGFG